MVEKNSLTLTDEFIQFCKLNDITNIEKYANKVFNIGFNIEKYGLKPEVEKLKTEKPKATEPKKEVKKDTKRDLYSE